MHISLNFPQPRTRNYAAIAAVSKQAGTFTSFGGHIPGGSKGSKQEPLESARQI